MEAKIMMRVANKKGGTAIYDIQEAGYNPK